MRGVILLLAALAVPAAAPRGARAEAPFFYDAIGEIAVVDTTFLPSSRGAAGLFVEAQAWTAPGTPGDPLGEQELTGQYRLLWSYPLDPRYELRVELKGDTRNGVVGDDYFLRGEFFYKGAAFPLWFYGGVRLPERANAMGYAGVETMSLRPLRPVPAGVRAFSEVRFSQDESRPVLRATGFLHTLPARGRPSVLAGVVLDTFFQDREAPRWIAQGHLEVALGGRALDLVLTGGLGVDLATGDPQVSFGVRRRVF
jgi:hypothetical protein